MTDKKERILEAALQLFADEGYTATSTSKVSKVAGVSEGLIFRHFTNKDGLLKAVLEMGEEAARELFSQVVFESDPEKAIKMAIEIPFKVYEDEDSRRFWRLIYKLKWEVEYNMSDKMELLKETLKKKFAERDFDKPEMEAEFLVQTIDGLGAALLKNTLEDPEGMKEFLIKRYQV